MTTTDTTPTAPAPARGWTPALKTRFLDRLAAHGNARAACRAVNLSREAAYRLRRRDGDFARGWAAAVLLARETGAQVLAERAIEGIEEEVWYRGEHVGTRRRYDSRLLLAHLARLDQLADERAAPDAARFDELLACIAGEDAPGTSEERDDLLPACRAARADFAADDAREAVKRAWFDTPDRKARKLGKAERAAYEAERDAAERDARSAADAESDAWLARAFAAVDAHAGWPASPPAPGLPGHPLPPCAAPLKAPERGAVFTPRTVSDVSTSALAMSLSRGVRATPRIALAPCRRGALRRSAIDLPPGAA